MGKTGIYLIMNLVTEQLYVGSAAIGIKDRFGVHKCTLRNKKHPNPKLQNSWNKYGENAFLFTPLEYVDGPTLCLAREQFWMDRLKPFFNIAQVAGSCLGTKRTEETKLKMSSWQIGRKLTAEHIAKSAASRRGMKLSEESRKRMSIAQKAIGKKLSPEIRAKISAANKGKKVSPEHRAKIAATLRGQKLSEQAKLKLAGIHTGSKSPCSKPILCVELDKIFESAHLAASFIKGSSSKNLQPIVSTICSCARGQKKFKFAYGFTWKYLTSEEKSINIIRKQRLYSCAKRSLSKPILCIELNREFESISSALRFILEGKNSKATASSISDCASGKYGRKSAYGYTWKFL